MSSIDPTMRSMTRTIDRANSTNVWPFSLCLLVGVLIAIFQPITRIETWRWKMQSTFPPLTEQAVIGRSAKPKGVPGINGENVYVTSTRCKIKLGASGSALGAGLPAPAPPQEDPVQLTQRDFVFAPVPASPTV